MIGWFKGSLVAKLALVVMTAVVLGFAVSAWVTAQRQLETMERMNREGAEALARSLVAGVRSAMLRGDGLAVREFLTDAEGRIDRARLRVYSPEGEHVFAQKAPVPAPDAIPPHVRTALASGSAASSDTLVIPNAPRCQKCHEDGDIRGVLSLSVTGAERPLEEGRTDAAEILARVAEAGFVQIMTGRHEDEVDAYLKELVAATPGLEAVGIYDLDGEPFFGAGPDEPGDRVLERALQPGPPFSEAAGEDGRRHVALPLENEPRCQGCHDDDDEMRGALVVTVRDADLAGERALKAASATSLEHVMLAGLGRLVNKFLDNVAATGSVGSLTLHDADGRLVHDAFARPQAPPLVGGVLASGKPVAEQDWSQEGAERFTYVEPLENEARCQTCHGADKSLRGAIVVDLDTSQDAIERRERRDETLIYSSGTVLLVLVLLYAGLRVTVLRPVRVIGRAAEAIGQGELEQEVSIPSADEMGRLASRINDMTAGLRQRMALSKFVSGETLRAVERDTEVARGGQRARMSVLFSDIRGFTSFSESREPEEVVDMLNTWLQTQADQVNAHGGDIDKFVGDELMARFDGPDHEARALEAAVAIVEAVEALNADEAERGYHVAVGVGVNTGDVVIGAMGAEHRMDYTVIGDAVNLAARLCSAAEPGQVITSSNTWHGAKESAASLRASALEPITVKGKSAPIEIWRVTRSGAES